MKALRISALIFCAVFSLAMARKDPLAIRFHLEGNPRDGESFVMPAKFMNPPRDGYISRRATLSERDILAIYPFAAKDGTMGCAFQLNTHGRIGLSTISNEHRGSSLVAFILTKGGSHQVIDMVIDRPVSDGIITIQRGMTQLEVAALMKKFPVIGAAPKRKEKPTPKPERGPGGVELPSLQ